MRPKIVILILGFGFGVLGIIALLKGVPGRHADGGGQTPSGVATANPQPGQAAPIPNPGHAAPVNSSNAVAETAESRAAAIEKDLAAIQELLDAVDGTNNPVIISALIEKVALPEPKVRDAALDALKQINDTNAVPGLKKAADNMKDPRGKVAVLDTIDYLLLPGVTDGVAPELATNTASHVSITNRPSRRINMQANPNANGGNGNGPKRGRRPNAVTGQPQ
jgi:hypothetical protein